MRPFSFVVLRFASLLIPRSMREEWLAEWRAELWYVRESSQRSPALFCLGAIPDAICVWRSTPTDIKWLQSPGACLLTLAAVCGAAVLLLSSLPGGLTAQLPSMSSGANGLVALWRDGRPTIPTDVFLSIRNSETRIPLSSIALYSTATQQHTKQMGTLWVARTTTSILDVLRISPTKRAPDSSPTILLMRTAWEKKFNADPGIVGRSIDIEGRSTRVLAVIPDRWWPRAAEIDALLLDDRIVEEESRGFALARLDTNRPAGRLRLPLRLIPVPLTDRFSATWILFLFTTIVVCLILPVATTLSLGELPNYGGRRWAYLLAKLALIASLAYCGSAYMVHLRMTDTRSSVLPHFQIAAYVCALRWALHDQRRRCPVCLHPLTHPIAIGDRSRIFLDSNITELVCSRGHGLMHIPETPTSWFAVQRWSNLDASWSGLFTR